MYVSLCRRSLQSRVPLGPGCELLRFVLVLGGGPHLPEGPGTKMKKCQGTHMLVLVLVDP